VSDPDVTGSPHRSLRRTLLLIVALLALFVWRSGKLGPPEVVPLDKLMVPTPVVSEAVAPREGYISPDFDARTLGHESVHLSALRGKAIFLNFWAPWCKPCQAEMASIGRLAEAASQDVRILTVALDTTGPAVEDFIRKNRIRFPVIYDEDRELGTRFEVAGIPTTLLLDGRGFVVSRIVGPRAWDRPEFIDWISGLAARKEQ